jgi:hypothetical protein
MMECRARQMVTLSEQGNTHGPACLGKLSGGGKAIAAIVAGTTEHDDGTHRPALLNLPRNGLAGILHKFVDRRATGNRNPVGFAHPADIE